MLFNSLQFIFFFLPLTLAICWWAGRRGAGWFIVLLGLGSLVFYGWWKWQYLFLILGSVLVNYFVSGCIQARRLEAPTVARRWLFVGVAINLALLGGFKYTNFLLDNLYELGLIEQTWLPIALPLAISFFTFQQIAFLVDCWRGEIVAEHREFSSYLAFVTFFPQLIAGPIVRHRELVPQLFQRPERERMRQYLVLGLFIFMLGLFKKVCIADNMADIANPVFNRAASGLDVDTLSAWVGTLAYTFQIYFDFSGYSDMAYGLGLLFGVRLPINFFSPYRASCINEFWRRWNITLGAFFRDYLYIPLGGGRGRPLKVAFNVTLVMFLSGLWHGAGWNFVLWGLIHGLGMVVATAWGRIRLRLLPGKAIEMQAYRAFSIGLTFLFASLAWVLFRSADLETAGRVYQALFNFAAWSQPVSLPADILQRLAWYALVPLTLIVFFVPNVFALAGVGRGGDLPPADKPLPSVYLLASGFAGALAVAVLVGGRSENFLYFIF
jgi:D-alanyl-lipoteichoic acid acyltransferase DltB (MBOAT superfamily)